MATKRKNPENEAHPNCHYGVPAIEMICQKPGPNAQRPFYTCESGSSKFFSSVDGKPWNGKSQPPPAPPPHDQSPSGDESGEELISPPPQKKRLTIEGGPFLDNIIKSSSRSNQLLNRLEILH